MRRSESIPQQILHAALMGPMDNALRHARLAHSRGEWNLIDSDVVGPGLANVILSEVNAGNLSVERALLVAATLLSEPRPPFAAALVMIQYWSEDCEVLVALPSTDVIELLDMLALEQEEMGPAQLLATAIALSA